MDWDAFWDWVKGIIVIALIAGFVLGLGWLIVQSERQDEAWRAWAAVHCKVIGKRDGQSFSTTGFSTSGNVVFGSGSTDAQTQYQCDDGITYWKDN